MKRTTTHANTGKLLLVAFILPIAGLLTGCSSEVTRPDIVWPSPPEKARIRFLDIFRDRSYFDKPFYESLLEGVAGEDPGDRLVKPYGVVADSLGRVYITDTGLGEVFVFDVVQKKIRKIGNSGQGKLKNPTGITIGAGLVVVADPQLKRVFGYDYEGNLQLALGDKEEFSSPSGVSYDTRSERFYIVDAGNHNVRVYGKTGDFLFEFGENGSDTGKFNIPTNIVVRHGKVYVVDTGNFRVQVFDTDGNFIATFGQAGNMPGMFARPKGIGVSSDSLIFIADAGFDNFQIMDEEGQVYLFVGTAGNGPGEFGLPAGLSIDQNDHIYVVDQVNARVQVFEYIKEE